MIRIFLDAEFTGLHQSTTLISIGLASENGALFYAELTDFDKSQVNPWLLENVLPALSGNLPDGSLVRTDSVMFCQGNSATVADALQRWLQRFEGKDSVEIWADVLAWDWVLFCELFGGSFSLPEQVYFIPFDLSTLLKLKGIEPNTTRENLGTVNFRTPLLKLQKHHALYDALLELNIYNSLQNN